RNILLRNFVEIVTSLRPTWFIMENVEGLLTANDGVFIIEAITHFLEAGYWFRAKKVYMEKHGLPQRRKRVIIVGNLEQCNFTFPEPTHYEQPALPTISAKKSPIKRTDNPKFGRQVDCLDGKHAYEFKMRVTIAASGQGRFKEELDFARDCNQS